MSSIISGGVEEMETRLCLGVGGGCSGPRLAVRRVDEDEDEEERVVSPPVARGWGRAAPVSSGSGGEGLGTGSTSTRRRNEKGGSCRTVHGGDGGRRSLQSDGGDSDGGGGGRKRKLRLTEEQAALLEDSFRAHNILSHGEKHDLARRLGLRPRQVEVWFQNRRARTKLKQTEVDRELLRRWHEQLSDENAWLRREIAEARRASSSSAVHRFTTTSTTTSVNSSAAAPCPSCSQRAGAGRLISLPLPEREAEISAVPSEVRRRARCSRGLRFRRPATVA